MAKLAQAVANMMVFGMISTLSAISSEPSYWERQRRQNLCESLSSKRSAELPIV
ncbi:hypothetical protein KL86SPO_50285 [uncultured Sporomusa sp.]|uniref:Uncharacterized protein n=1 Tax=uncultured Sporomusa sp. TaxID=307249 RepID=A0A212LY39_9FIRM|nr:hypothetical protein KL86SPO_50285 [uncultured Sporomusa sp.]